MTSSELKKQLESSFLFVWDLQGVSYTIEGETFKAIKGSHGRGRLAGEDFIVNLGSEVQDSTHLFWISTLRSLFPTSLLTNGKVNLNQGDYLSSSDDPGNYQIEEIVDDSGSPWLRFQVRET